MPVYRMYHGFMYSARSYHAYQVFIGQHSNTFYSVSRSEIFLVVPAYLDTSRMISQRFKKKEKKQEQTVSPQWEREFLLYPTGRYLLTSEFMDMSKFIVSLVHVLKKYP